MTNWKLRDEKAKKVCELITPKIKELKNELKVYEVILAFYASIRIKSQRKFVPITIVPPSISKRRPENIASNIVAKAKALSPNSRRELIKALEGELVT